jgi:hypothetical protein
MVMAVVAGVTVDEAAERPPLSSAIAWPFRGSGPLVLLGGTLMFSFIGLFSPAIVWCLMLGYGMTIIQQTATGRQDAPDWPEVESWGDIARPAILGLAVAAMSFGPAAWFSYGGASAMTVTLAVGVGTLYAPMAWMAASVSQRFLAITPLTVIPLLTRTNASYWMGCGLLFVALFIGSAVAGFLSENTPIIVDTLVGTAAALYFVMVEMRILGLVWFRHREDFGLD